jgi:hypothetical protein
MIGERLANARALRRANGQRTAGRIPLGYAADPRTKQLLIIEQEAAVVRWFFAEAASGKLTGELVGKANALGFAAKDGKRAAWSGRAVLRLLQNPAYAGRLTGGASAIHTALVPPELFDRVQTIITSRQTRAATARPRDDVDERFDPFILRSLLTCAACGRTMTTSMSTALTANSAKSAPRYYRCRTPGCSGGQIVASEVERLARNALAEPLAHWPDDVKTRLRDCAVTRDGLWPINRRRALVEFFASMTWQAKTQSLFVVLREVPGVTDPG